MSKSRLTFCNQLVTLTESSRLRGVTSTAIKHAATDEIFKALADPTRREILAILLHGRYSVGDLAANFHVSRPAISKHIKLLRKAGLVKDEPHGATRICELNAAPLASIDAWLADYKIFWDTSLSRLKAHVERH